MEWKAGVVLLGARCSVITGHLLRCSAPLPACAAGSFSSEHDSLGSFIRRSFIKAEPTASLDPPASAVKSQESPSNVLLHKPFACLLAADFVTLFHKDLHSYVVALEQPFCSD